MSNKPSTYPLLETKEATLQSPLSEDIDKTFNRIITPTFESHVARLSAVSFGAIEVVVILCSFPSMTKWLGTQNAFYKTCTDPMKIIGRWKYILCWSTRTAPFYDSSLQLDLEHTRKALQSHDTYSSDQGGN